jgi:hypothetical protein
MGNKSRVRFNPWDQFYTGKYREELVFPAGMKNYGKTIKMPIFSCESMSQRLVARSVETLRCQNKREIRRQEGVSPPPCPTPIKIFFGQGFPKAH